jgi:hypothetical protein
MKNAVLALWLASVASLVGAQTTKPATAKPAATKPAAAKPAATSKSVTRSKAATKTQVDVKKVVPHEPVGEAVLGANELALAERVHVGILPCELGNSVHLTADPKQPGYFDLHMHKVRYRLVPVPTTTGAIRLEDAKAGAVWLQLGNKSMLMNHKLGQRMADECKSPQQIIVAEQIRIQPPPSVLDAPPPPPAQTASVPPADLPAATPLPPAAPQ